MTTTLHKLVLREMTHGDIEAVIGVERSIYPWPWTARNFSDSLNSGYLCTVAELEGVMAGYAVMIFAPYEAHLLTIGIASGLQRQGWGSALLDALLARARQNGVRVHGRARFVRANAFFLPYPDAMYDVAFSQGFFEHFEDEAIEALLRVDAGDWTSELDGVKQFFAKFGDRLPAELHEEVEQAAKRLHQAGVASR